MSKNLILSSLILLVNATVVNTLTEAERNAMLKCHNDYRSQLAKGTSPNKSGNLPQGKNIKILVYDQKVENSSAKWAEKCSMGHSQGSYGENLYMTSDPNINITKVLLDACNSWWSECKDYGVQSSLVLDMGQFNNGIGHCTQMAWANTKRIGCAVQRCPNSMWKTYVVCQYDPPGNYLGQTIYQKGQPCTGCGNAGCNSTGLCN
ncbi:hypothetical protein ACQ4LE_001218 [Meloidogyne hapla]|uniref:SCP domain-containing protein n=1 Tax=Meloidogyne hapla TaxID=6305 RepID=A0A1I8BRN8_MELHA